MVDAVAEGALNKTEIQTKIVKLREKKKSLKLPIERCENRLKDLPGEQEIAQKAKKLKMKME